MISADPMGNVDVTVDPVLERRDREAWVEGHAWEDVVCLLEEVLAIANCQSRESVLRTDQRTRWTRV